MEEKPRIATKCAKCGEPFEPGQPKFWSSKGISCLGCSCDRLNEQAIDDYFAERENDSGCYTYSRDKDGTYDTFNILDPGGKVITTLYFWDEPDTSEAQEAEAAACSICAHLNGWGSGELRQVEE